MGYKLTDLELKPPSFPRYRNSRELDQFIAHCSFAGTTIGTKEYVSVKTMQIYTVANAIMQAHDAGRKHDQTNVVYETPLTGRTYTDGLVTLIVRSGAGKPGYFASGRSTAPKLGVNPALAVEFGAKHMAAIAPLRNAMKAASAM